MHIKKIRRWKKAVVSILVIAMALQPTSAATVSAAPEQEGDIDLEFRDAFTAINEDLAERELATLKDREAKRERTEIMVSEGSDRGFLMEDGYTYVFDHDVSFENKFENGNGMEVAENAVVFMEIKSGVTVTAKGGDATFSGAGAGVRVPESSTLVVLGEGTLQATGGDAYAGLEGETGWDALCDIHARSGDGIFYGGKGGAGGIGGGGAGAGIGGNGGAGGAGGKGGLFADAVNTYSTNGLQLPLWAVSAPAGFVPEEDFGNLFNADLNKKYCVKPENKTLEIVFKTNGARSIGSYTLVTANDTAQDPSRNPLSWMLYGSNNRIDWEAVDRVDDPGMQGVNFTEYQYPVSLAKEFRYYKFVFATNECFQMAYLKVNEVPMDMNTANCSPSNDGDHNGYSGEDGQVGELGAACGSLFVLEKATVDAKSGEKNYPEGNGGTGGKANSKGSDYHNYYIAGGGGGGGAGEGGIVAEFGIGAGGTGGSGGGGGGAGSTRYSSSNCFDSKYPFGGTGGAGGKNGAEGQNSGTQKGGNGGNGGAAASYGGSERNGKVYQAVTAKISGRNDGDIRHGTFIINEDGEIVNTDGIPVDNLENLTFEDGKIYVFNKNLSYTNDTPGGNGLTIPENTKVIFEIDPGVTITVKGGPADGRNGAGAGIYVPESSSLVIRGGGILNATGGDAADGKDGKNAEDAKFEKAPRNNNGLIAAGNGGNGGNGGGGAGAGIGGAGGNGGTGGKGGIYAGKAGYSFYNESDRIPVQVIEGNKGEAGETRENLLDGNKDTKWCVLDHDPYLIFDAGEECAARGYTFMTANDNQKYPERLPSGWKLYGSKDNSKWTLLQDVKKPAMKAENFREFAYGFPYAGSFRYYKFEFDTTDVLQFSEFKLFKAIKLAAPSDASGEDADVQGTDGQDGSMGERGTDCGTVYIMGSVTVNAVSGKAGSDGKSGAYGTKANDKGSNFNNYYTAGKGAGGGGGCGGEAADYGIGGGGAGGAGGGGGGSGATRYSSKIDYNEEHANGGAGGTDYKAGAEGRNYGTQHGGHGGACGARQLSGVNGEVFVDYASNHINGRPYFVHKADLAIDAYANIIVKGYSDLVTNFSGNATPEMLAIALREMLNHGGNVKDIGYKIMVAEEATLNGDGKNAFLNGAYANGSTWNKNLVDCTGGYVYLFSVVLGSYIKSNLPSKNANPEDFVAGNFDSLKKSFGDQYPINDECKRMMKEIFYAEHYYDIDENGNHGSRAYTYNNPTSGSYTSKGDALHLIDYSYTTVLDLSTARYLTLSYDTIRSGVSGLIWKEYGYVINSDSFTSIDGYKGVTMKNWMQFLPDTATIAQVNMPGTHDSGTFNPKFNWDMVKQLADHGDEIGKDIINGAEWYHYLIAMAAPTVAPVLVAALSPIIAPILVTAGIKFGGSMDNMIQYVIDGIAKCNDLSITEQLDAGIRTMDLRMCYDRESGKSVDNVSGVAEKGRAGGELLKICHGTLEEINLDKYATGDCTMADGYTEDGKLLTLNSVIDDCRAFLKEHNSESLYLFYKCEGSDFKKADTEYSKALQAVLDMADADPKDDLAVIRAGEKMPTVKDARGMIYLIYTKDTECVENDYDVTAEKKIGLLKTALSESEAPAMRQKYDQTFTLNGTGHKDQYCPRLVYASTYHLGFNAAGLVTAEEYLSGTPRDIAIGKNGVNKYLDSYMFHRGQYYGWIYMNYPTQAATSNIVFSNIFDMAKLTKVGADK